MSVNPIETTKVIKENYKSYLLTTLKFADDSLQSQFKEILDQDGKFVKGPILEATPSFVKGCSIRDLVREGVLSSYFEKILSGEVLNRPLHLHQEKAIRKVIQEKRNIIVATGTGSGKTETFIIPILNALFREMESGTLENGGVRALLLYPMNALANDQLNRLRGYLKNAPFVTFGRYTGETKETYKEALENYQKMFGKDPLENELISRDKMWENPPHILLTNYAMLEYLLLRPKDSVFFDGEFSGHWKFIVMDEVHTYSGAKGIETAMLLRRLKDRIGITEKGQIQCIGTSATLGRGKEDFKKVVDFAEKLFGEEFQWEDCNAKKQDVIEGERIPLVAAGESWGKPLPEIYLIWQELLNNDELTEEEKLSRLKQTGINAGISRKVIEEQDLNDGRKDIKRFLYRVLSGDARLLKLQEALQGKPRFLKDLVAEVMEEVENGEKALAALVDLAVQAQPSEDCQPLLPARYHVFVRAIEGAYISLLPEKKIYLERREKVEVNGQTYPVFEVATCRYCGAAYLVGIEKEEHGMKFLVQASDYKKFLNYYLLNQANQIASLDEDDDVEFSDVSLGNAEGKTYKICEKCGAIDEESLIGKMCSCGEENYHIVFKVPAKKEGQAYFCPVCGKRSSQGVMRRFSLGADAVSSVLATALYKQIKPKKIKQREEQIEAKTITDADDWDTSVSVDEELDKNGKYNTAMEEKRKLLIFSDSRQEAAFFAPYLNRTYNQILYRSLIVEVLKQHKTEIVENSWRLQDLVNSLQKLAEDAGLFGSLSVQQQKNEIYKWLMKELISMDRYINLGAFGLLYFELEKPRDWKVPNALLKGPWNLTSDEAWTLFKVLYDTIRVRGAVQFPDWVSPEDEFFYPQNRQVFFRLNQSNPKKRIICWYPNRYNSRLDYLLALAKKISPEISEDECRAVLKNIYMITAGKGSDSLIRWKDNLVETILPGEGVVYQLKYNVWAVRSTITHPDMVWYRCQKCQMLTPYSIKGVCPNYRCDGHLEECRPEDAFKNNHYYKLYFNNPPLHMKAEEHTAQLTSEAAAELQTRFNQGDVQVLSCSTTFELGVDVGELEAVFMRNMPPSAANYIQRAGRAGRRVESAAYVLTFAQRRPHDLTYFYNPLSFVAGQIKAPHVSLSNEKIIKRHVYATAFSEFWRENEDYFGTVEEFFFNENGPGTDAFKEFIEKRPEKLRQMLIRIVPQSLHKTLGLDNWAWAEELLKNEKESPLLKARDEIENDVYELKKLRDKLYRENKNVDRLSELINTITQKNLINFLSSRNVLPKYGFPVDVVELQITHHGEAAKRLQLERDLRIALSEYAPDSQVVAGGQLWTSRYLKLVPNRTWERYKYAICGHCHSYYRKRAEQVERDSKEFTRCCFCGESFKKDKGTFIIPAFGFMVDNRPPGKPGENRPEKTYSSRVYYSGEADEENVREIDMGVVKISLTPASHGKLAVINDGEGGGFKVCYKCGYSELANRSRKNKNKSHVTAWGQPCKGILAGPVALGHEFETDILKVSFAGYKDNRNGFWLSLLYALLEGGSEALEIERNDLDGCLYPVSNEPGAFSLILFDDVPGGAGHVKRMAEPEQWIEVMKAALDRMERCQCGGATADSSCYGCLRNYRNQFCHDELNRGMVIRFLRQLFYV